MSLTLISPPDLDLKLSYFTRKALMAAKQMAPS